MIELTSEDDAVLLPVKVVAGASRTRYLGEWDGRVKLSVAAPPEKGRANKAVSAFLADLLGLRKSDVTVTAGHTSPVKTVRVVGLQADAVRAALQSARS